MSYSWPWKELGLYKSLFLIISHFLVSCPFWYTLLLCTNHRGFIDWCWGAVDLFLFKLYVCSKVQEGWQPPVYNHCSHTYRTWLQVRLLKKKINSWTRHLVIMIQFIWAAAWESIFLEKFAGISDHQQDLDITEFEYL